MMPTAGRGKTAWVGETLSVFTRAQPRACPGSPHSVSHFSPFSHPGDPAMREFTLQTLPGLLPASSPRGRPPQHLQLLPLMPYCIDVWLLGMTSVMWAGQPRTAYAQHNPWHLLWDFCDFRLASNYVPDLRHHSCLFLLVCYCTLS